ncbi:hypothetical protein KIN20_005833, partial [Parelaphostrongylus tenuis]
RYRVWKRRPPNVSNGLAVSADQHTRNEIRCEHEEIALRMMAVNDVSDDANCLTWIVTTLSK